MKVIPGFLREGLLRQLLQGCLVLLFLLGLALAIGVVLVVTREPPEAIPPAPETLSAAQIVLPSYPPSPIAGEMLARPLFWASRRPVMEAPANDSPSPVPKSNVLEDVKILGMFASGERAGIIYALGKERRRLLEGETLDGWRLESLDSNSVLFADEDGVRGQVRLTLEHAHVPVPDTAPETDDDEGDE